MKKILLLILSTFFMCSCTLTDDFTDKYVYTSSYPLEFATSELYKEFGKVESIYPNSSTSTYKVTEKKKNKYAQGEIFVYSGIANEATLAKDLLNINENIKLIDATKGMNTKKTMYETWLDPSNYLMLCSNIKSSLIDYTQNVYTKEQIEKNYKKLNEKISELDVLLYNIGKNGNYKKLLVTNNIFKYLNKYNIEVISIDENEENLDKSYATASKLIKDKNIKYIYHLNGQELTKEQNEYITNNNLTKVEIPNLFTLTDEDRKNSENYISLMKKIIEEYKKELYKK